MTLLHLAVSATGWRAPSPTPDYDPDMVTPGVIGFGVTFLVAAVTILLILDMNRRIRRVRYRGELRERLDAERAPESPTAPED